MAVLAAPSGLAHVPLLDLRDRVPNGLPVGHLGLADVGVDLELPQHPVDEDLEVELAHTRDDGLAGLLVGPHAESGILVGQGVERLAQLVLVRLRLRLDGDVDHRLGEDERLQQDRVSRVTQRVAGRGRLEADDGDDVAGIDGLLVLPVVGVHLQDAADPLLAVLRGVEDARALGELAGVDPQVGQLAHERVGHDLEGECGERFIVAGARDRGSPVFTSEPTRAATSSGLGR